MKVLVCFLLAPFILLAAQLAAAEAICADAVEFAKDGWEHPEVKDAMDDYLRDHRMRGSWGQQPAAPSMIGRDYYEWLWHSEFGAGMKSHITARFCSKNSIN